MDEISKEYVVSFFEKSLRFHGNRPEAVRWTGEGQEMHYRSMLDIGDLRGMRVLDYGCGTGDFLGHLRRSGIDAGYCGTDISPALIDRAKEKYPDADFRVFDIEDQELGEGFDFIMLCGVFNLRVQGIEQTVRNVLQRLFPHCRKGLAFNALSSHTPRKDPELSYLSPEEMLGFCIDSITPYVSLRLDRMLHDFTLFLYRERNRF